AWQGSDTLWVVGDAGVVLRLTAGEWTKLSSGVTAHLNGVSASAGDQVWICGSDALLNWDGQTFMPSDRPI
ncbi:MAG: hypothetical protein QGH20_09330, partial [Candidatus Latescibacteria bacterium]|nr:hypothetical protein [Candidatus Latescibacterota bacterium]